MPDPTLSAAIREAYASAPTDTVIYHTLELRHPAFSAPIRVVRDYANIDAKIETTSTVDPGAVVAFVAYAFDIVPPDMSADALPQCTIEIDNVSREILAQLDAAILMNMPIKVVYRAYLSDALLDGPENDPPLELTISRITATPLRISATAGFTNLLEQRFPGLDYELETFPGLAP